MGRGQPQFTLTEACWPYPTSISLIYLNSSPRVPRPGSALLFVKGWGDCPQRDSAVLLAAGNHIPSHQREVVGCCDITFLPKSVQLIML